MIEVYFYTNSRRAGHVGKVLSGDGILRIRATSPKKFAGRVFEVPRSEVRAFKTKRRVA